MARNVVFPVTVGMLASVFLEDCRESCEKRENTAETTVMLDVDVTISTDGSYDVLTTDTVKLATNHSPLTPTVRA